MVLFVDMLIYLKNNIENKELYDFMLLVVFCIPGYIMKRDFALSYLLVYDVIIYESNRITALQ